MRHSKEQTSNQTKADQSFVYEIYSNLFCGRCIKVQYAVFAGASGNCCIIFWIQGLTNKSRVVHLNCTLIACGVSGSDAVLWKREEIGEFNHKMLWFEGKKMGRKSTSFCPIFLPIFIDA